MTEDLSILSRKASPPDRTMSYGTDADQVADLRLGQRGEQLPMVVLIHGGFWKPQYDRAHAEAMSSALATAGWTVLTLEYRRIPGNADATLDDIAAAIQAVPSMAAAYNGKIVTVGHSAGGHLALWAAVKCTTPMLHGVLALAPAADLCLAHALHLGDGAVANFLGGDPANRPEVDPMRLSAPSVAVTLIQGSDDDIVPPAVAESYCAAFPATRLVQLPDTGHFALIDPSSLGWAVVIEELNKLTIGHD